MNIIFNPLEKKHFKLLFKWLKAPYVKKWWDAEYKWTLELIKQKYNSYTDCYKLENGVKKKINAYIIYCADQPIGYIQIYNAYDFKRSKLLEDLPIKLAAFDIFIGEEDYLNRGIGTEIIFNFLDNYCDRKFTHVFADPDINNIAAIRAYEKAGFKKIIEHNDINEIWMIKKL